MVLRRRALVVLEGGGAKGVAHAGALAAIEDAGYEIRGVAGTSAGSLVAALVAIGLRADDILNTSVRLSVLDELGIVPPTAPALLGAEWAKIAWLKRLGRLARCGPILGALGLVTAAATGSWLSGQTETAAATVAGAAAVGLGVAVYAAARRTVSGIASLDPLERHFDRLTRSRLKQETPVTFADLIRAGRPALKMVATDLTSSKMQLFSAERTPEVRVSEAVAASACLPLAFAPRKIKHGLPGRADHDFTDGGLVSNLPAWVFDAERTRDRDLVTICVELTDPRQRPATAVGDKALQYARAAAFGAGDLSVRGIPRRIPVEIPISDKMMATTDFDATWDRISTVVSLARDVTEARLRFEDLMTDAVSTLADDMKAQFGARDLRLTLGWLRGWECKAIVSDADYPVSLSPAYRAPLRPGESFAPVAIGREDAISNAVRTGIAQIEKERGTQRWRLAMPPLHDESQARAPGEDVFLMMVVEGEGKMENVERQARSAYDRLVETIEPILARRTVNGDMNVR